MSKKSYFSLGSEISVSEFARYCAQVMRHCETTGQPVKIRRGSQATLTLIPANLMAEKD